MIPERWVHLLDLPGCLTGNSERDYHPFSGVNLLEKENTNV